MPRVIGKSIMRIILATAFAVLVQCNVASAQVQLDCSSNPQLATLDFWFGEWRVEDDAGNVLGRNTIYRMLNGCVIQERWQGTSGGVGISMFYVDPETDKLSQLWVTGQALSPGGTKEKLLIASRSGEFAQFQGSYPNGDERILDRTTLSKLANGDVLQVIEFSRDDGITWETGFRGIYIPAGSNR